MSVWTMRRSLGTRSERPTRPRPDRVLSPLSSLPYLAIGRARSAPPSITCEEVSLGSSTTLNPTPISTGKVCRSHGRASTVWNGGSKALDISTPAHQYNRSMAHSARRYHLLPILTILTVLSGCGLSDRENLDRFSKAYSVFKDAEFLVLVSAVEVSLPTEVPQNDGGTCGVGQATGIHQCGDAGQQHDAAQHRCPTLLCFSLHACCRVCCFLCDESIVSFV